MKSDILDLRMIVHGQTDRAIRVSEDGDVTKAVWLPLSQVEVAPASTENGVRRVDVQIPQWLAEERRLV